MNILLIGCGKMGSAMLAAWLDQGLITRAVIIDHEARKITEKFSAHQNLLTVSADVNSLPADFEPNLVIFAIKPQQMPAMLTELAPHIKPHWPMMTIVAGLRSDFYTKHLPGNILIRVMPNTPAMLGRGMTIGVLPPALPPVLQQAVENLLSATGDFFWLENEDQLDAAMAISGSGPAYFVYLAEQMAKFGEAHGLTTAQTLRLARQTLIGTGALALAQSEKSLEQMRLDVTSPGGVTAAAIAAWDKDDVFQRLVTLGLMANMTRAQELAQS